MVGWVVDARYREGSCEEQLCFRTVVIEIENLRNNLGV
jgi:hypothetical protein